MKQSLTRLLTCVVTVFPQLEEKVASLQHEIGETNSELETLLQWRDTENQGGNLIALLKSDIEQSKEERFVHLWLHNAWLLFFCLPVFSLLIKKSITRQNSASSKQ